MILSNGKLEIAVKNEGAELTSIKYNELEYLWHGKEYWKRQAPILFPIVGRLNNDTTIIEGKEYHMNQHGFARDMVFEEAERDVNKVTYLLKFSEETLKVYPYKFELYVSYEIIENKVKVTYKVKNVDDKNIVFFIGGHPAFNWPLVNGESFEDYYIKFEKKETQVFIEGNEGCLTVRDRLILDNEDRIDLSKTKFDIDTFVLKDLNSKWVSFNSKNSNHSVKMYFDGFPYFGIWSRMDDAPFICLEPWVGVADYKNGSGIFEDKDCAVKLKINEEYSCSYIIEFN